MARSATLFFALALLALVGTLSASGKEGFSALTATDGLCVFDGLDALKTFKPSRILSLPLGGESAVAASANRAGDFVVISNHATVSLSPSGQFEPTHTVSDTHSFSDLGFFNSSSPAVALGVEFGFVGTYQVAVSVSKDGGFSWSDPTTNIINQRTTQTVGSISFGIDGFGVVGFGGYIATTSDGNTWSVPQSSVQFTTHKVATYSKDYIIATGISAITGAKFAHLSTDGFTSYTNLNLPSFTSSISGIAFITAQDWSFATTGGEIWRTVDGGNSWNLTSSTNVAWNDLSWSDSLKAFVAVGTYHLHGAGALAYSADGVTWTVSSPINETKGFVCVVPAAPSKVAPSATPSASPTLPFKPSASPTPSITPYANSASPSPMPTHSPLPSPMATHSASPTSSANVVSTSPSPSQHSASPMASASPSTHSATRTPSASPNCHSPGPTPSHGYSHSPSPSPAKKNDDSFKLSLLLVGLGGGAALIAGIALIFFVRKCFMGDQHRYQAINTWVAGDFDLAP